LSKPPLTLLGFDFGTRRIGIALGQTLTHTARPLTTLESHNNKPDWDSITKIIKEWQPQKIIVGLPLHMDGTEQEMTQKARRFGNQLKGRYNLSVEFADERLTSDEAEQLILQNNKRSTRTNKNLIDAVAAQLILQSWMSLAEE
jgi:putative Holliday junction resolvase